jgi:hypothetical protein
MTFVSAKSYKNGRANHADGILTLEMIAQELVRRQNLLFQAARNLDAFEGEWVVLRGDSVVAHNRLMDRIVEQDVIESEDAVIHIPEAPLPQYSV